MTDELPFACNMAAIPPQERAQHHALPGAAEFIRAELGLPQPS
jgi:hypothetical protein